MRRACPAAYQEEEFYARSEGFELLDFSSFMTLPLYKMTSLDLRNLVRLGDCVDKMSSSLNLTRFRVQQLTQLQPSQIVGMI